MKGHRPAFHEDSAQELFNELHRRVLDEEIETYGEYCDLVAGLLEERVGEGVFDSDEELPTIENDLRARWPEIEATIVR